MIFVKRDVNPLPPFPYSALSIFKFNFRFVMNHSELIIISRVSRKIDYIKYVIFMINFLLSDIGE